MPVGAQKAICQNVPSRSADIHSRAFDSRAQDVHTHAAAAMSDEIQDEDAVPVPFEHFAEQTVEHDEARAVRAERCEPGRIGDFFERVVAAAKAGMRKGERFVPVVDLVAEYGTEC